MASTYTPPPVMVDPKFKTVRRQPGVQICNIIFDIEATELDYLFEDILSIGAVTRKGEKVTEEYIFPLKNKTISNETAERTGLELIIGDDGEERMFLHGEPVEAVSLESALKNFIDQLKNRAEEGKINLMAHNCRSFDVLILCEALNSCNLMQEFESVVFSITDTDHLFKKAIPGLPLSEYKLEKLALRQGVLADGFSAHNALEDARLLGNLLSTLSETDLKLIDSCTYTWVSVPPRVQYINRRRELFKTLSPLTESGVITKKIFKTLSPLTESGVITKKMARLKIAGSGFSFHDLEEAFNHSGMNGLTKLLSEKIETRFIKKICHYFESLEAECCETEKSEIDAPESSEHNRNSVRQHCEVKSHMASSVLGTEASNSTQRELFRREKRSSTLTPSCGGCLKFAEDSM